MITIGVGLGLVMIVLGRLWPKASTGTTLSLIGIAVIVAPIMARCAAT